MYKTFNQVIDDFMMSESYKKALIQFQDKEFWKVQHEFYHTITKITAVATQDDEQETEKIETLVINYLGLVEKLGVLTGFQFAFNLFQDLNILNRQDLTGQDLTGRDSSIFNGFGGDDDV